MTRQTALIIGAGPAGLTAACELLDRTQIVPVVLEKSDYMGGLSRTVNCRGNRIDIGGHRFFSKSDRVMQWWLDRMPLAAAEGRAPWISYQGQSRSVGEVSDVAPDPQRDDRVMLVRPRRSRICYQRQFFDYPLRLSLDTIRKLGPVRVLRIAASYAQSAAFPIRDEETLEHFFINRFGRELYHTFFRSYTEKVWGRPCSEISAEWGAQRVKGLSIGKALVHAIKSPFARARRGSPTPPELRPEVSGPSPSSPARGDVAQKGTETSLIEQFLYPKYGPGQMWELAAEEVKAKGGLILTHLEVQRLQAAGNRVTAVEATDVRSGRRHRFDADYVFSTMPVKHLVRSLSDPPPGNLRDIAEGLVYRDFITVGLLVNRLKIQDPDGGLVRDNWIYIQEPDVQVGRLQVFNNWSPYLVADPAKVWLGMEYFCNEHDDLWIKPDRQITTLAVEELARIGIVDPSDVLDASVIRMEKTYPAYFGAYERFGELRQWLDEFENLFLIGRNGMHRYNNMDHSMLTAMTAVENILAGRRDKTNLWAVNAEQEYHEEKHSPQPAEISADACSDEAAILAAVSDLADALAKDLQVSGSADAPSTRSAVVSDLADALTEGRPIVSCPADALLDPEYTLLDSNQQPPVPQP